MSIKKCIYIGGFLVILRKETFFYAFFCSQSHDAVVTLAIQRQYRIFKQDFSRYYDSQRKNSCIAVLEVVFLCAVRS